jgi:uncharacterized protein (TIGR02284 family)
MSNDDVIVTLNQLIATCRDGELGFRTVADKAQSPPLQVLFTRRADECALAAADLATCVRQLGGTPDSGGSASGALHRGWIALRSGGAASNDLVLLEECERGEEAALERYRRALQDDLPEPERTLVSRQLEGVQRNSAEVRALLERERVRAV